MKLLASYRKKDSWVNDQILILHFFFLIYFDWLSAMIQALRINGTNWILTAAYSNFLGLSMHHFSHVSFLIPTNYIHIPVSPSILPSVRLKLLFFSLLRTMHGCISGLFLTHMHNWSLLLSLEPYHSHIPSGRLTMHHNYHPALIPCIIISITAFFSSVTLHWEGFEPMTFPSEGQAANH